MRQLILIGALVSLAPSLANEGIIVGGGSGGIIITPAYPFDSYMVTSKKKHGRFKSNCTTAPTISGSLIVGRDGPKEGGAGGNVTIYETPGKSATFDDLKNIRAGDGMDADQIHPNQNQWVKIGEPGFYYVSPGVTNRDGMNVEKLDERPYKLFYENQQRRQAGQAEHFYI